LRRARAQLQEHGASGLLAASVGEGAGAAAGAWALLPAAQADAIPVSLPGLLAPPPATDLAGWASGRLSPVLCGGGALPPGCAAMLGSMGSYEPPMFDMSLPSESALRSSAALGAWRPAAAAPSAACGDALALACPPAPGSPPPGAAAAVPWGTGLSELTAGDAAASGEAPAARSGSGALWPAGAGAGALELPWGGCGPLPASGWPASWPAARRRAGEPGGDLAGAGSLRERALSMPDLRAGCAGHPSRARAAPGRAAAPAPALDPQTGRRSRGLAQQAGSGSRGPAAARCPGRAACRARCVPCCSDARPWRARSESALQPLGLEQASVSLGRARPSRGQRANKKEVPAEPRHQHRKMRRREKAGRPLLPWQTCRRPHRCTRAAALHGCTPWQRLRRRAFPPPHWQVTAEEAGAPSAAGKDALPASGRAGGRRRGRLAGCTDPPVRR